LQLIKIEKKIAIITNLYKRWKRYHKIVNKTSLNFFLSPIKISPATRELWI